MSYTAFDACLTEEEFENYVPTFFCNTILGSDKSTLNPADNVVTPFTDIWVHSFKAFEIKITVNATLLTTFNIVDVNKIYVYNFGYQGLLALGHTLAVGDVVTIDVRTTVASLTTYTYTIQDFCSRYDVTRLYYLSRSGRILYKQFSLASTKRMTKKTSNVRLGKGNVISGIMVSNRWDREVHEVANVTTYTSTLTSDWISEAQNEALQELFDSPIVWQHDGTNYIPVTITDTSFDFKKHNSDKLFNYTVNIEYNTQETRQRGL